MTMISMGIMVNINQYGSMVWFLLAGMVLRLHGIMYDGTFKILRWNNLYGTIYGIFIDGTFEKNKTHISMIIYGK